MDRKALKDALDAAGEAMREVEGLGRSIEAGATVAAFLRSGGGVWQPKHVFDDEWTLFMREWADAVEAASSEPD